MCGFAGYFLYKNYLSFDKVAVLKSMAHQIRHRGPDDERLYCEDNLGMIFRRLSIVDINGGQQPLKNEDGSIVLMVNGEIYNYRELIKSLKSQHQFRTDSDCEVLLHLYEEKGIDFLKDINGMFALVLWDKNQKKLILSRDRMGIKPLYYSNSPDRLIFGSELKALFAFPDCEREFNWYEALDGNKKNYVSDDYHVETYFKNIHQLKGGQYLVIDHDSERFTVNSYWSIFDQVDRRPFAEDVAAGEIISQYYNLLAESVNLMLLGDAEIGLFLSGGIDSSAIAALASKKMKIKTFSVFNKDTVESGDSTFSNKVATALGLENYQVEINYKPSYHDPSYWKELVWQCETYECGTEQLFKNDLYHYIKIHFPAIKIVLLGQGSDEFNGGYAHKYLNPNYKGNSNKWQQFEDAISGIAYENMWSGNNSNLLYYHNFINRDYLADLKKTKMRDTSWYNYINSQSKILQLYQLLHEDRNAMGNSIENRVPFLDHRIIELITMIPRRHFESLFWNKSILRKAMAGDLDEVFCNRPKVPFIFENKNPHSRNIILDIFSNNGDEIVNYALGERNGKHDVLDRMAIENLFQNLKKDPDLKGIDELRFLVNMGILSKKVKEEIKSEPVGSDRIDLNYNSYCNLDAVQQADYEKMLKQVEKKLERRKKEIQYKLSDKVEMLTDTKRKWYVFFDGELVELIDGNDDSGSQWVELLQTALNNDHDITKSLKLLEKDHSQFKKRIVKYKKLNMLYKEI